MKTFGKLAAIIVAILFTGSTINILIDISGSGLNPDDILPIIATNTLITVGCVMAYKKLNNSAKSNEPDMMSLVCPKCDTYNSTEAKFCKNCGADIAEELKKRYEKEESEQQEAQEKSHKKEPQSNTNLKNKNNGLIIASIVIVIAIIGVLGFGMYYINSLTTNQNLYKSDTDNLILRIKSTKGEKGLIRLSFHITSTKPSINALVKSDRAKIIAVIENQISARNSEELLTTAGRDSLREELINEINSILSITTHTKNMVNNISFTTFVIKLDSDKNAIVQNDNRNPKAEAMAQYFVQEIKKVESTVGANPNMSIKTYNIGHRVYHDRTEYNYKAKEIQPNIVTYKQQLENEYCPAMKIMKDTYGVEFIFNIYGNDSKKVFTHTLNCR